MLLMLLMAAAGMAAAPVYYLNDDVMMRSIVAGACTGAPDGHAVYMGYPLTLLLAALYRLSGWLQLSIPWFDLFMGGCILLSGVGILMGCLELARSRHIRTRFLPALAGILLFAGLLLPHYLYMHYTVTAAILAAGALFLWTTEKGRALPVVLLALCYLVRSQVFFLALPFLLVAVLDGLSAEGAAGEVRDSLQIRLGRAVRASLPPLLALGAVVTIFWGVDCLGYGSPQWRAYREYNDSRTRLYDYTDFLSTSRYQETYEQLGLDWQQYQVLSHYDLLLSGDVDGELLEETARRIEELGAVTSGNGYLRRSLKSYYLHVRYDGRPYSLLWAGTWGLLLIVLAAEKKWRKLPLLAALLSGRSLIWLYLIARGRFPERIWLSLYLMEICLLLGMLLRECAGGQKTGGAFSKRQAVAGCFVLALALLGASALGQLPETLRRVNEQQGKQEQWKLLTERLESREGELYLMDVFSAVPYAGELYRQDSGRILLLGGWLAHSPLAQRRLAYYDAEDGAQALRHEQVYLLAEEGRDMAWLQEYLEERLGEVELRVQETVVCGEDTAFVIYRLVEGV